MKVAQMDGDTSISRGSWTAALKAAGAVCRGVDQVMQGKVGLVYRQRYSRTSELSMKAALHDLLSIVL